MHKRRISLNKTIIMIILLAPLIEPSGLEGLNKYIGGAWRYLHIFTIALKCISFLVVIYLSVKRLKKIETISWLFIGYQGLIALMTLINSRLSFSVVSGLLTPIIAALLFQYYIKDGDAKRFLRVTQFILGLYIFINLITVLLIPGGMYIDDRMWRDNWILGYRNLHIYYFLPFLAICGVNEYIIKQKIGISIILMTAIMIASAYFSHSTTTIVALILVFAFIILFENKSLPKIVSIRNICIGSLIVSILFIFFSYQNKFAGFIDNFLGKDITLSRRTLIWEKAASEFFKHPIWGYGVISYEGLFSNWDVTQMHNMFLDMLIVGGIALFAIFAFIIYLINKRVDECNVPAMKNICVFVFFGYAVLFVTEARRDVTMLFIYMSLCYYLPYLVERYQIKDNKKRIRYRYISRGN